MKRLILTLAVCVVAVLGPTAVAQADFGLNNFKVGFTNADGTAATQAGSHPFAMTTSFGINFSGEGASAATDGRLRDVVLSQIVGLAGNIAAYPRCSTIDFITVEPLNRTNDCPLDTAVGITGNSVVLPTSWLGSAVFSLVPPPGVLLRLGFHVFNQNLVIDVGVKSGDPYNPVAAVRNISEQEYVFGSKFQLWGNPSDPRHDAFRGNCYTQETAGVEPGEEFEFSPSTESCSVPARGAFLTLPTRCSGQNLTSYAIDSYEEPGTFLADGEPALFDPNWVTGGAETPSFTGCGALNFSPSIVAKPTTRAAQSPTGLDFALNIQDEGLVNPADTATAQSDIRKAVVTLPEGMTANPSLAEGLAVCTETDLARETVDSGPGDGCPEASRVGTLEVETPLIEEALKGSLYVAKPHENLTEDSLIGLYMVIKSPKLGIIVKQPTKVEPDPQTGRLVAITDNIPQLPFSHFALHFREGGRSPLISPPGCGSYQAEAVLTPWSGGTPVTTTSAFTIVSGPNESGCPAPGAAPFRPGFTAGSVNNAAGNYSPFYMHLTRSDGEQDMTRFSAKLPPGMVAKLAGTGKCSDASIAAAKAKSGLQEQASPSCPASSEIGHVTGGAGVGSQLTYVPGTLYLAGPTGGAPLSVVAIVPAVAGPFDVGNVVVRQALRVNPRTAEVTADGAASDPLPHILAGIPLNVRDIRVHVDKPDFTLNPTSCEPFAVDAQLWGGGSNVFSSLDDHPVALEAPFQAASCASLGFKPRLGLKLNGGTERGGHPKLRGVFRPRSGDANLKGLVLRLPHSAFLDQAHIRTICTRVQFAANGGNGAGCPAGAIYGHARAFSPILDEPLEGPVFLRSSNHNLPDFVAALHGIIDIEAVARIDSKNGGIRASFANVPDAPLSKVVVDMRGGRKGLIVNSTNLCHGEHRANAQMAGQNGRTSGIKTPMQASCGKK
jgi:hypothetical protein